MIDPRTMPGVLELLPSEQVGFQAMVDRIRSVFERFGFLPIATPAIEYAEVLLTKSGGETERQVYFVQSTGSLDQGGRPDLALRFDLTVPLARYVAEHEQDLVFPFRRYQIQPVYRGESPQRGRFREFHQCDIDVVDRDELSLHHDAEMPAVIEQVFEELGIGPFTIRINNRRFMRGVLRELGVLDDLDQSDILREIDKLERRGTEAVEATLVEGGLTPGTTRRLLELVATLASSRAEATAVLDRARGSDPVLERGIDELRTVLDAVDALGVPEHRYALDLSIARGLDYYTGTVYETTLDDHPDIGSICSGGRYDDLAGQYTNSRLPGVGISIGLTRLYWQLREAGLLAGSRTTVEALVALMDEEGLEYSLGIASTLRRAGVNTESVVEPGRLGRQLKNASRSGIRFVVIAGSEERARYSATVRDLDRQTQVEVGLDSIAAHILDQRPEQER
jgi:histidyl-tRNA synthetase